MAVAAILSFGLGVLATLIAQATTRRHQLEDARRERGSEKLQLVRDWMEFYRKLFQCKYPDILELVFAHKYLVPFYLPKNQRELSLASDIYAALQEYQQVVAEYDVAEKLGVRALKTLGPMPGERAPIFRRKPPYFQIERSEHFIPPAGLELLGHKLQILYKHKEYIFETFPQKFSYKIEWEKLAYTKPENVGSLVLTRFPKKKYPPPPKTMPMETEEDFIRWVLGGSGEQQNELDTYWENYQSATSWSEEEVDLVDSLEYASGRKSSAISEIEQALDEIERLEDALL